MSQRVNEVDGKLATTVALITLVVVFIVSYMFV